MLEKDVSTLLGFRESIRVVDATLRDGGLCNDHHFKDEFVRALYQTNIKAGVDYMELGYKGSKELFSKEKYGKWKFTDDEDVLDVIGENQGTGLKLAVMADVGRCDYKNDIRPRSESPIDMIRVATYINQMPAALHMIEDAKNKGYEVSCNIMAISAAQEADVKVALSMLGQSPVDVVYIVDSFGALYPEQINRIADIYLDAAGKYGKDIGMHAHNNQQLAFANTLEACGDGADYLDATYGGLGRGAGNCSMENLLGILRNPKYQFYPVLKFVEDYVLPLKKEGVLWGYDLQYLMTGIFNQHPRTAIAFTKEGRSDYTEYYKELMIID
ncbi:MAG: aldolase catalytic domain-containing protein [Lachnospiraceae bacterium]|nr:aldolase catalytic domain-containing protein [Lachnospiraceae bacterium]